MRLLAQREKRSSPGFDLAELLARVGGLLRRKTWWDSDRIDDLRRDARFRFGNYWVDFRTWPAKTLSGVVELSQKELAVLKIFAERPNEVITRRELLADVWELPNHPNTRVVDNVIGRAPARFRRALLASPSHS